MFESYSRLRSPGGDPDICFLKINLLYEGAF